MATVTQSRNSTPIARYTSVGNGEGDPGPTASRQAALLGGWALITAAVGFIAVFAYLAVNFGYPDVLDAPAADVFPHLLALGPPGRSVWIIYALLPLLLVPAGIGAVAEWRATAPNVMSGALVLAVVAAVSMLVGLARWPTLHWELAQAYSGASPDTRAVLDAVFAGANLYLGNFIGELLGELSLNGFFLLSAIAMLKARRAVLGYSGLVVGSIGLIAALRNVTTVVGPVAEANNLLLPIWLIVLGIVLVRGTVRV
jgi:hypothetical protein